MTVEKDVENAVHKTMDKFKKLDVLVPCAGILYRGSIEAIKMDEYDELMNVNMRSVLLIIKLATPHLIATKGNIVNVSSVTGLRAVRTLINS
jgi:NADP-dependent 3-hydroxy acid dehydrogenase YdfG